MTKFQLYCQTYQHGCGSDQCEGKRVCLARGQVPAEIVLVGEAPGHSENVLGRPFVGPAGRKMDEIIRRGIGDCFYCQECKKPFRSGLEAMDEIYLTCPQCATTSCRIRYALTNLVGCLPRNEEEGGKADEPSMEQIEQCSERLRDFIRLCSPRLVVCVGKLSKDWLTPGYKHSIELDQRYEMVSIIHPAAILRAPYAAQGLRTQEAVVTLANAVDDL